MSNIISNKWLIENLEKDNLVILDCRFSSENIESYKAAHIKGAIHIDIEQELRCSTTSKDINYLNNLHLLKQILEGKGISDDTFVVVYDEGDCVKSSTLLWILKYLGHKNVYILNGGIAAYIKSGGKIESSIPVIKQGLFKIDLKEYMKANTDYIKERLYRKSTVLIDCRELDRFNEILDPIKELVEVSSIELQNYYWKNILREKDSLTYIKNNKELYLYFNQLRKYEDIIICSSPQIDAGIVSLALDELGINHRLYIGELQDLINGIDNEIC